MSKKLIVVDGVGIINTWDVKGKFEIQYSQGKKGFIDYYEAVAFYNELSEPASFYDKTHRKTRLLEKKDWEKEA
jgi:hypothetical protein